MTHDKFVKLDTRLNQAFKLFLFHGKRKIKQFEHGLRDMNS